MFGLDAALAQAEADEEEADETKEGEDEEEEHEEGEDEKIENEEEEEIFPNVETVTPDETALGESEIAAAESDIPAAESEMTEGLGNEILPTETDHTELETDTKYERGDAKESSESDEALRIASHILKILLGEEDDRILDETITGVDSAILRTLKETEDDAQKLTARMVETKNAIKELQNRPVMTLAVVQAIDRKQAELLEMLSQLESITQKVQDLLTESYRTEDRIKPTEEGEEEEEIEVELKEVPVCICKPEICICEDKEPYVPGTWLEQQVDPFPYIKKTPEPCVCLPEVCVCEEEKECECKKEDLETFSYISDIMPKVIVCAPDIMVPRIIVAEPYTPRKLMKRLICP